MDMVWEVVDWLRQAVQLTRDRDIEMEALALSSLGKVYDKVSSDDDDNDARLVPLCANVTTRSVVIMTTMMEHLPRIQSFSSLGSLRKGQS